MRVCIVGSSKRFFSGLTTHTIFLANAMAQKGHKVGVVTMRNLVPLILYPGRARVGKGDFLPSYEDGVTLYDGMDWNSPASWIGATSFVKKMNPDLLIMFWWTSAIAHMQAILAIAARHNKKTVMILEMHEVVDMIEEGNLILKLYSRMAGRFLMSKFDAYTVHSEEAKNAISTAYSQDLSKIHVIPIGMYEQYACTEYEGARKQLGIEDGYVIANVGMIRKYKGIIILVRAFNSLPRKIAEKCRLLIAGEDWSDDPQLQLEIDSSVYRDRIIFKPGFIPDDMLPRYFCAADLVALPYLRTSGSGVAQIAVAQGKPIISSDLSSMRECLAEYQGATFTPPGDVEALKTVIIKQYSEWASGGSKNYAFYGASWMDVVKKYEIILNTDFTVKTPH